MEISKLIQTLSSLPVTQQLEINRALCQLIKQNRKVTATSAGMKFFPGQVVSFNAKTRGTKFLKIEKFNRSGTAVVGFETNSAGEKVAGPRWTVTTTLCAPV